MDTTTNFRISIPKPCHEDWNKMTPDQKGAFCKVCNKSVHDFTKKEPEEIKTILIEEISAGKKVCGRFNEDQISPSCEPIQIPELMSKPLDTWSLNFQRVKKFAVALFLVFGGYLFNSVKSSAQKMGKIAIPQYNYPIRGEIAIEKEPEPVIKDTARTVRDSIAALPLKNPVKCDVPKGDVKIETLGKIDITEAIEEPTINGNIVVEQMKGQVAIIETPIVTGSVAIVQEPVIDMGAVEIIEEPIIGDTVMEITPMIYGMVITLPEIVEEPILINPVSNDTIQNIVDGEFAVEESTFVEMTAPSEIKTGTDISLIDDPGIKIESYPNPTSNGMISLRYDIQKDGIASISLFDLNGNLAKKLMPMQSLYASSYETKYDVSDLKAGVYFCELISGNNKTTTRIVISK